MPAKSAAQTRRKPRKAAASGAPLPFDRLRSVLARLRATGENGFEGLVAAACSQIVGVPFRLVGSGRQFGRDLEAEARGASVLFEAKRYSSRLAYADLATKLIEAIERSGRAVEVWGAAATVALDAADARDLLTMGEKRGITVLILDWTPPMPPLAVLLAMAGEAVIDWFSRNGDASATSVAADLTAVRSHPLYAKQAQMLQEELRGRSLGLALARRRNADWICRHFSDVGLALHRFNQPLAPLDAPLRPLRLERTKLESRIQNAIGTWTGEPGFVLRTGCPRPGPRGLEGDEGVGKSWAVARSWLKFPDSSDRPRPLLL